jgi:hydroxymethylglutaryl-CoA reductase
MRLHARNIAAAAGARSEQIDSLVEKMTKEGNISINRAKEILGKK